MIDQANGSGTEPKRGEFLVVGIGGSTGGVSALRQFFSHVPANSGMAFVVILRLPPEHQSIWASQLQSEITVSVKQVTRTVKVEPNHLYVLPPLKYIGIRDGHIRLEAESGRG